MGFVDDIAFKQTEMGYNSIETSYFIPRNRYANKSTEPCKRFDRIVSPHLRDSRGYTQHAFISKIS